MIEAVLIDYGGTLAAEKGELKGYVEASIQRLLMEGIEINAEDYHRAFLDTVDWRMSLHEKGVDVDSYEFLSHVIGVFGHEVSRDVTDELEMLIYQQGEPVWLGDTEKVLKELSEDYKVVLVSNAWLEGPRLMLRKHGYGRYFDAMVVSYDLKIPKPDPRIFQHSLNLIGVDAREAVMVGDRLNADIYGALNAGLQAIWVDPDETGEWDGPTVKTVDELPDLLKRLNQTGSNSSSSC